MKEEPPPPPSESGRRSPEFNRFERFTKRLLQVPKKEINDKGAKPKR